MWDDTLWCTTRLILNVTSGYNAHWSVKGSVLFTDSISYTQHISVLPTLYVSHRGDI